MVFSLPQFLIRTVVIMSQMFRHASQFVRLIMGGSENSLSPNFMWWWFLSPIFYISLLLSSRSGACLPGCLPELRAAAHRWYSVCRAEYFIHANYRVCSWHLYHVNNSTLWHNDATPAEKLEDLLGKNFPILASRQLTDWIQVHEQYC